MKEALNKFLNDFDIAALLPNLTKLTIKPQTLGTLNFVSSLTSLEELDLTGCRFAAEDRCSHAARPHRHRWQ